MSDPTLTDTLGLVAAALTLATFAQRRMLPMRLSAIAANLCFIGYGSLGAYLPVLGLHLVLLPLNLLRLRDLGPSRRPGARRADAPVLGGPGSAGAIRAGLRLTGFREARGADRFQLGRPLAGPSL